MVHTLLALMFILISDMNRSEAGNNLLELMCHWFLADKNRQNQRTYLLQNTIARVTRSSPPSHHRLNGIPATVQVLLLTRHDRQLNIARNTTSSG